MIRLKRVYERPDFRDGITILVDRLWPRGVRRSTQNVDLWLKEVGPSDELRKWYQHDPKKWVSFKRKYVQELEESPATEHILMIALGDNPITLVYSASDKTHNNAVVLKDYLDRKIKRIRKA